MDSGYGYMLGITAFCLAWILLAVAMLRAKVQFVRTGMPTRWNVNSWGGIMVLCFMGLFCSAVLILNWWGFLERKNDIQWLKLEGKPIEAQFLRLEETGGESASLSYRLTCKWRYSRTEKDVIFTLEDIPSEMLKNFNQRGKVRVLIDPDNPADRYYIEAEALNNKK